MKAPDAIVETVLEILRVGLLRIRYHAAAGDPERCVIEADHIHNLPSLIANYSPDLLAFYCTVERPAFERRSSPRDVADFLPLWNRLAGNQSASAPAAEAGMAR